MRGGDLALAERLFGEMPTAGLDPLSATEFDELIRYLHANLDLTIVIITHDVDTLFSVCDRVAVLVNKGIIVDTLDGIVKNPDPWIQKYFGDPRARRARLAARARRRQMQTTQVGDVQG